MSASFVHPTALVESDQIGAGTRIWAFAHVMAGARVGAHCNIGDHCFIESGVVMGDDCILKNANMLWEGVTLEDGVFVGPHAFFTNDLHPRSPRLPEARRRYEDKAVWLLPTRIKRGASLGAGCVILAGITVGEYAMVGAGAVVSKDVPAHALVLGAPARVKGWVCRCGGTLRFAGDGRAGCKPCRLRWTRKASGPQASRG